MNPEQMQVFNQAVQLAQSGQREQAYAELKKLSIATGAKDTSLLLWLAFTSPDIDEAETAISMAETQDPASASVMSARNWLMQEKAKNATSMPQPSQATYTALPPDFNSIVPTQPHFRPTPPPNPRSMTPNPLYYHPQPQVESFMEWLVKRLRILLPQIGWGFLALLALIVIMFVVTKVFS